MLSSLRRLVRVSIPGRNGGPQIIIDLSGLLMT